MIEVDSDFHPRPNAARVGTHSRLRYLSPDEVNWDHFIQDEEYPAEPAEPKRAQTRGDLHPKQSDTGRMSEMSRDEIQARLDASEANVDARLASFDATMRQGLSDIRLEMAGMRGDIQVVQTELAPLKGLRSTIVTTALASVIAIAGLVSGIMAYGISSFDSGRETSAMIAEAKQQAEANRQLLREIQAQQRISPAPPTASPQASQKP